MPFSKYDYFVMVSTGLAGAAVVFAIAVYLLLVNSHLPW
jgi:hypothetical protein